MKAFKTQLELGITSVRLLKEEVSLKDTSSQHLNLVEDLFIRKVTACSTVFDFSDDNSSNLEEKDIKRKTLLELIQFLEAPLP